MLTLSIAFLVIGGIMFCLLPKKRNRVLNMANAPRTRNTDCIQFDVATQSYTPVHISLHPGDQVSLARELIWNKDTLRIIFYILVFRRLTNDKQICKSSYFRIIHPDKLECRFCPLGTFLIDQILMSAQIVPVIHRRL